MSLCSLVDRAWRPLLLVPVLAVCVLSAGCANKDVTKAHFDKIRLGMNLKQVEDILGPPDEHLLGNGCRGCTIGGRYCRDHNGKIQMDSGVIEWMENHKTITLKFKYGRVTEKKQSGLQ